MFTRIMYLALGMAIGGAVVAFVMFQMLTSDLEASRKAFPFVPLTTSAVI